MAYLFVPWGEDVHSGVFDCLSWTTVAQLSCVSKAFRLANINSTLKARVWWGQAQSTQQDIESLLPSLVRQRKVLSPSARPNFCMLMIDSAVLLTTTVRELCGRLHSAHLVPLECPIVVVESDSGVFGAGVSGEGNYSKYIGRDVELDPPKPVTGVLTVAYIPSDGGCNGGPPKARVQAFIVDSFSQNRRNEPSADGVEAVFTECAPIGSFGTRLAAVKKGIVSGGCSGEVGGASPTAPADSKGSQRPLRRSSRASTVAHSKAASQRVPFFELSPPSSSAPLEDADTVLILGDNPHLLAKTSAWLQKLLGEEAMILGGISSCALCIGNQVFPGDKDRRTSRLGIPASRLCGVALRGVHALAISAKGYQGVGPVFRIDTTANPQGDPQAGTGKLLRDVTVVSEGGAGVRTRTALSILHTEVYRVWGGGVQLGVGASPAEFLRHRSGLGDRQDEARGAPPIAVDWTVGDVVVLDSDVTPGQHGRFVRSTTRLVLADTEAAYNSCKRRIVEEGSVVLSCINFTCSVRPDHVKLSGPQVQQDQQQQQQQPDGGDGNAMVTRVMALHQQEMVRFVKTLNAPAAGVFCEGELGPVAALSGGIFPRTARSRLQGFTSCGAVLCWNPDMVGSKYRASGLCQGV